MRRVSDDGGTPVVDGTTAVDATPAADGTTAEANAPDAWVGDVAQPDATSSDAASNEGSLDGGNVSEGDSAPTQHDASEDAPTQYDASEEGDGLADSLDASESEDAVPQDAMADDCDACGTDNFCVRGACHQTCAISSTYGCLGGNTCCPVDPAGDSGRGFCVDEKQESCCTAPLSKCQDSLLFNPVCVDLMTDPQHCGSCSTQCQTGYACADGVCECVLVPTCIDS